MLAVVFEEFEMVYMFLLYLFYFSLSWSIGKRSTLAKIWGGEAASENVFMKLTKIKIYKEF